MKSIGKILSILLSLIMIISLSAVGIPSAQAVEFYVSRDGLFQYRFIGAYDGVETISIRDYLGTEKHVVVPAKVDGYRVEAVSGFYRDNNIESVVLSEGIMRIGERGFSESKNLKSVSLPDSLVSMQYCAFYNCDSLESIVFPPNFEGANWSAFSSCDSLKSVTFSRSMDSLSEGMFRDCVSLETIDIPKEITVIGSGAFEGCVNLREVNNEGGFFKLESNAFAGCTKLEKFNTTYVDRYIGEYAFKNCKSLKEFDFHELLDIYEGAFYGCSGLESINIPYCLFKIEDFAFEGCSSLESITVEDRSDTYYAEKNVLYNKKKPELEVYPAGSSAESFYIPEGIETIADGAFADCDNLVSLYIPKSVTTIAENEFRNSGKLENIIVDPENEHFASLDGVLYNKDMTRLIKYPEGKKDRSFTVPETVKTIPVNSVSKALLLEEINIATADEIDVNAFSNSHNLKNINIAPENSKYMSVDGVVFAKDGKSIFKYPMGRDETVYKIPNEVEKIGPYAFMDADNLEDIDFGDGVETIYSYAFAYCDGLVKMELPQGLKRLSETCVFYDCKNLQWLTVPKSLEQNGFGYYQFGNKFSPRDIYYEGSKMNWFLLFEGVDVFYLEGGTIHFNYKTELLGDCDISSEVNVKDASLIQKDIAKIDSLKYFAVNRADADRDGDVTVKDATLIQKYVAKAIDVSGIGEIIE